MITETTKRKPRSQGRICHKSGSYNGQRGNGTSMLELGECMHHEWEMQLGNK